MKHRGTPGKIVWKYKWLAWHINQWHQRKTNRNENGGKPLP